MPKRPDLKSILIIGAGPIVIGQACEFDYSGTQACKALKEEGYRVILVNSNPATIMTDPEFADVTYIEPLTVEILEKIIAAERPSALLPTLGGQTALNLSMDLNKAGILAKYGVEMIGAKPAAIAKGEDRELFKKAMLRIGLDVARSRTVKTLEEARSAADELGMRAEDFELVYQDTSAAPYDMGATGSQTLFNNGRAVVAAAAQVAEQLKALAAERLEADPADIVLADGAASVAGSPAVAVPIAELAATAAGGELLLGRGSGTPPSGATSAGTTCVGDVGLTAWLAPQFSCHAVRVRVDRDTGVARVLEVHATHDSGTIINPIGAEGQVEGAILMGIGQAITEGTTYGDDARQRNAALLEYKLQTCADAPRIGVEFVQIATPDAGRWAS